MCIICRGGSTWDPIIPFENCQYEEWGCIETCSSLYSIQWKYGRSIHLSSRSSSHWSQSFQCSIRTICPNTAFADWASSTFSNRGIVWGSAGLVVALSQEIQDGTEQLFYQIMYYNYNESGVIFVHYRADSSFLSQEDRIRQLLLLWYQILPIICTALILTGGAPSGLKRVYPWGVFPASLSLFLYL